MPLQIQYQPNAMMLGSMAQSAGEASYNRWLTEFNQQKMQMNANAFATGFANMGLPIAQMKSRERMLNAQIAGRGQQLAQKGMADVQWWNNNSALFGEVLADNMISQHGPDIINDPMFPDMITGAPKHFTVAQAQKMTADWLGNSETARAYSQYNTPQRRAVRTAKNSAAVEKAREPNKEFAGQVNTLRRRLSEGLVSPKVAAQVMKSIEHRLKKYGNESEGPTKEEMVDSLTQVTQNGLERGNFGGSTEVTLDPTGRTKPTVTHTNIPLDLAGALATNAKILEGLNETQYDLYSGEARELTDAQKNVKSRQIRRIEAVQKSLMSQMEVAVEPTAIEAAEEYGSQVESWLKQSTRLPVVGQSVSNKTNMDRIQKSGILGDSMKQFGVTDPAELPAQWWKDMGFSAPPPKKPDTRGVIQRNQEETQNAVKAAGVMDSFRTGQTSQPTGQTSQPPASEVPQLPLLREQVQSAQQQQRQDWSGGKPKTVEGAKNLRSAIAVKYGRDPKEWPPEILRRYRDATEFLDRELDLGEKPKVPKVPGFYESLGRSRSNLGTF